MINFMFLWTPSLTVASGAIIASIVGAILGHLATKARQDKKQLSAFSSKAHNVLEMSKVIKNQKIEVFLNDKKTETLISNEIDISNTGNKALQKISIQVTSSSNNNSSKILGIELVKTNINSAKKYHTFSIKENIAIIEIDFLNPKDSILLRFFYSDIFENLNIEYREPNVTFKPKYNVSTTMLSPSADSHMQFLIEAPFPMSTILHLTYPEFRAYKKKHQKNLDF